MKTAFGVERELLVASFCSLAEIASPSGEEETIANAVVTLLKECGLIVGRDAHGNVIGKLAGRGKPLILCAHLDTVALGSGTRIKTIVKDDIITSDGTTILGADNKDAVAAILETVRVLRQDGLSHRPLEIVFTLGEEAISRGARELDLSMLEGKECVISDLSAELGTVVVSAPGCSRFEITVRGKRCHVKDPEQGVNAALIAARAMQKMPLGRIDDCTTSNIAYQVVGLQGIIDTLDATVFSLAFQNRNTVPDLAILMGEVRGLKPAKIAHVLRQIDRAFRREAASMGGGCDFLVVKLADGYTISENNPLFRKVKSVFGMMGVEVKMLHSLGGSDANVLNNRGIKSIVVSGAHRNNHQLSEYVIIDDLVRLAEFFILLATHK